MDNQQISVIVAAHNEAACVGRTLRGLVAAAAAPAALEVIVVNAGSTDNGATQVSCIDTPTGSRRLPSEAVIDEVAGDIENRTGGYLRLHCPKGRSAPWNTGAQAATGQLLLFHHADNTLPKGWDTQILANIEDDVVLGAFQIGWDTAELASVPAGLHINGFFYNATVWLFKKPEGNNSLFCRKEDFAAIGGFPDLMIMEDYAFVALARKHAKVTGRRLLILPKPTLLASARRQAKMGVLLETSINQVIKILYAHFGLKHDDIYRFYYGDFMKWLRGQGRRRS
eukprot:scaffold1387_cov382-Prasinococcus_capsulatus_cf.AAC.4